MKGTRDYREDNFYNVIKKRAPYTGDLFLFFLRKALYFRKHFKRYYKVNQ